MAGEIGEFVIGTDMIGGSGVGAVLYAGGALPGTWGGTSGIKPEKPSVARLEGSVPQIRPETVA